MNKQKFSLRRTFFPDVSAPVQAEIDRASLHNLRSIAMIAAIMELLITVIAFLSDIGRGQYSVVSYISTGSCGLICLIAFIIANTPQGKNYRRKTVNMRVRWRSATRRKPRFLLDLRAFMLYTYSVIRRRI